MPDLQKSDLGVMVATVWRIPHFGGLSTHTELLIGALERNGMLVGSVVGNNTYGSLVEKGIRKVVYGVADTSFVLGSRLASLMAGKPPRVFPWGRLARPSRVKQMDYWTKYLHLKSIMRRQMSLAKGRRLVIHTQDPLSTCAAIDAGIPGCAIVETVHGPWSKEYRSEYGFDESHYFVRMARRYEDKAFGSPISFISVDQGQADILINDFGVPANRIKIIQNAVDVDMLEKWVPIPLEQPIPSKYFLVPRRTVPKNGVEFAIRGFAKAALEGVDLVIAGDGPLLSPLQKLAAELHVQDKVHFLGGIPRDRIYSLIKNATGVIVSSVPSSGVVEATSLSVLEGMAIGSPVIGSAIGGIAEIIENSSVGYPIPPCDPEAMAAAIRSVNAMDESSRAKMIQNARMRIRTKFGIDQWLKKFTAVYNEALDEVNRPTRLQHVDSIARPHSYSERASSPAKVHAEMKGNG